MKKRIVSFLTCILVFISFFAITVKTYADGQIQLTCETSSSMQQGSSAYCYVKTSSLQNVASINVSIYFDPDVIEVKNSYNIVSASLYDSSINDDNVNYSYIFDGNGSNSKQNLFRFYFTVKTDAKIGNTYFDIIVMDAYDSSLNELDVSCTRCNIDILEKVVEKTCYISKNVNTVNAKIGQDFEIRYTFSISQIASGAMSITYDSELFELEDYEFGSFLNNKITDINTNLTGSVYLSFLGTEYSSGRDIISLRFITKKNVNESSVITSTVTDLYDLELNSIKCSNTSINVNVSVDESYIEDAPKVYLYSTVAEDNSQCLVTVKLDGNSNLGAGDFKVEWDTDKLTYNSYTKLFSPSFFNVNVKNVDSGLLKFSIISMNNIVDECDMISFLFDINDCHSQDTALLDLSGSGITDALTNQITLNIVDCNFDCNTHLEFNDWVIITEATCTENGLKRRTCVDCDYYEEEVIDKTGIQIPDSDVVVNHSATLTENFAYNYYYTLGENGSLFGTYDEVWLELKIRDYSSASEYAYTDENNVGYNLISKRIENWKEDTSKGYSRYRFSVTSISASEIGNLITASLHANKDSQEYYTSNDESSIKQYAYSRLEKSSDERLKSLLVDLLNYSSTAQQYFNYNPTQLANTELTEAQRALGTQEDVVLTQEQNIISLSGETKATISNKSVVLGNSIELKYYMTFDSSVDVSTSKLVLEYESISRDNIHVEINGNEFGYDSEKNRYYTKLSTIAACDTGKLVSATIYIGDEAISDTLQYGIEVYCKNRFEKSSDENLKNLLRVMLKYTRNATSYFES